MPRPALLLLAGLLALGALGAAAQDDEPGDAPLSDSLVLAGIEFAPDPEQPVQVCLAARTDSIDGASGLGVVLWQYEPGAYTVLGPPAPIVLTGALAEAEAGACYPLADEPLD